ncbi:hypothetical protein M426DRAFT_12631 [Hypoxylon sp. CI-4A]|nr:hypothetical protein M426DRAFT_12631 [Hypoxylon sp. CI-4A]
MRGSDLPVIDISDLDDAQNILAAIEELVEYIEDVERDKIMSDEVEETLTMALDWYPYAVSCLVDAEVEFEHDAAIQEVLQDAKDALDPLQYTIEQLLNDNDDLKEALED